MRHLLVEIAQKWHGLISRRQNFAWVKEHEMFLRQGGGNPYGFIGTFKDDRTRCCDAEVRSCQTCDSACSMRAKFFFNNIHSC